MRHSGLPASRAATSRVARTAPASSGPAATSCPRLKVARLRVALRQPGGAVATDACFRISAAARSRHCGRGQSEGDFGRSDPAVSLQVVAEHTRLSAVQAAGRAGHGRASGPQYPGVGSTYTMAEFACGRIDARPGTPGLQRSWPQGRLSLVDGGPFAATPCQPAPAPLLRQPSSQEPDRSTGARHRQPPLGTCLLTSFLCSGRRPLLLSAGYSVQSRMDPDDLPQPVVDELGKE